MGLFNWGGKNKKAYGLPVGKTMQYIGGQLISPADNKESYITEGYTYNDIIYSIINLILDKVRLPEWNQYKVVDESSLKSYLGLMKRKNLSSDDHKKALDLKVKALELVPGDSKIAELLKWANENEPFGDFVANGTGFKLLTGDRVVWAEKLDAGANAGKPHRLINLPSQHIAIRSSNTFPAEALSYLVQLWNVEYKKEDIIHDKFWNPEWNTTNDHLYGLSPLKAALRTYTRNNYAKLASASAFENGGMRGIVSADVDPALVDPSNVGVLEEQARMTKKLLTSKEYSGAQNFNKIAAAAYRMSWTQVGLSPVDLNILESEKWDLNRLCAVYGVPSQLLGNDNTSTYNNLKEAEKALTARVAIPALTSFRNCLNKYLGTTDGLVGKGIFIDFDQTVFTELEENTQDKVDWVTKLWMLSPNKQLELLNLETVDDKLFDEPWVDQSRMPLSDFQANVVDNNMNGGEDSDSNMEGRNR